LVFAAVYIIFIHKMQVIDSLRGKEIVGKRFGGI